jgi:hypothetical protein
LPVYGLKTFEWIIWHETITFPRTKFFKFKRFRIVKVTSDIYINILSLCQNLLQVKTFIFIIRVFRSNLFFHSDLFATVWLLAIKYHRKDLIISKYIYIYIFINKHTLFLNSTAHISTESKSSQRHAQYSYCFTDKRYLKFSIHIKQQSIL